MFTWICPKCGKEVDVSQKNCPRCADTEASSEDVAAPAAPDSPDALDAPEAAPQSRARQRMESLEIRPLHLALCAALLLLTVLGAVWLSRPDLLRLETVGESEEERVQTFSRGVQGPFEVAGIRPYYTDDYQTKVKAFVVNHSDREQSVALRVLLRHQQATDSAPPLAGFDLILPQPLGAREAFEIDMVLDAMGSLQSLPPWQEIRVDIDRK